MAKREKNSFKLKLKELGFKRYTDYLKSDHWEKFRKDYWKSHKKTCCCCKKAALDLHHLTYKHLGKEKKTDVVALCRNCHDKVHKIIREHKIPLNNAHKIVRSIMQL